MKVPKSRTRRKGLLIGIAIIAFIIAVAINAYKMARRAPLRRPADVQLVITGHLQGRFELCGCPGKKAGSLPRRAWVLRQFKSQAKKGTNVLLIDTGDFVSDRQSVDVTMRAFKSLNYDLISLAPNDYAHIDEILKYARELNLTLLARADELHGDASKLTQPTRIIKCGQYTFAFITTGNPPESSNVHALKRKWSEVWADVKRMRTRADGVFVINYWNLNVLTKLLKESKATEYVDLVISNNHPNPERPPAFGSVTMLVGMPFVFVSTSLVPMPKVLLWIAKGTVQEVRTEPVHVLSNGPQDGVIKRMVEAYYKERQKRLEREWGIVITKVKKSGYIAPQECAKCHEFQYRQWRTTKHARALLTLRERHRIDPECLRCHSEEYRQIGHVSKITEGRGVECASCHTEFTDPAKARKHGQLPSQRPSTKMVKSPQVCVKCHTEEHSPDFLMMLNDYLNKVKH